MNSKVVHDIKRNPKVVKEITVERPERIKLTAEESLKRMVTFDKRRDKFIAMIKGKRILFSDYCE
ncbi:MAG: hypothetical protein ACRD6X_14465 [Pyrinomonadaceae bacterium]